MKQRQRRVRMKARTKANVLRGWARAAATNVHYIWFRQYDAKGGSTEPVRATATLTGLRPNVEHTVVFGVTSVAEGETHEH